MLLGQWSISITLTLSSQFNMHTYIHTHMRKHTRPHACTDPSSAQVRMNVEFFMLRAELQYTIDQ